MELNKEEICLEKFLVIHLNIYFILILSNGVFK